MKNNNNEKKAGRLIVFLVLLIIAVFGFVIKAASQPKETKATTGYLVVVDKYAPSRHVDIYKTTDAAQVNRIFETVCKVDDFSIVQAMDSTLMFEIRNEKVWVYCEQKQVKVKKNGKVKYRRWKR